jgi:trimethylamine---corrinoid protein Co-methyltransferase
MNGRAKLLTDEEVEGVHQASLEILAEVGIRVDFAGARERFAKHGCMVDSEANIVRLPPGVVEEFRALIPPTFTFHGRDPQFDRTIPDDGPLFSTASAAPDMVDPVDGRVRRGRSDDVARLAHMVNELPGYDVLTQPATADDAPPGQFCLSALYPALKNTEKPVRVFPIDRAEAEQVVRLGEEMAGGREAFLERPFITCTYGAVLSPLLMDRDTTEMLLYLTEAGVPAYDTLAPIGGVNAPASLAGTMALINAEWLAVAVLVQMTRPRTPQVHSFVPVLADLRTGAYSPGGVETGMMAMGMSQLARFYNVPSGASIGQTNAKIGDVQAGGEKGVLAVSGTLGGIDILHFGGILDAFLAFDYGQMVIDAEIAMMAKRLHRGMEFSEENLALDAIHETGPGGMFVGHAHTLERMKTAAFLPEIAERQSRQTWAEWGSVDAQARALHRAHEILSGENAAVLAPEVDARVRAAFDGLVAGDSVLPEGWEAVAPPSIPRQRPRRRRRRG